MRVCLEDILSSDEALCDLGIFFSVASYLSFVVRRQSSAIVEILCLIEKLEDLHTEVQGIISSPNISTGLIYNVSQRWSL